MNHMAHVAGLFQAIRFLVSMFSGLIRPSGVYGRILWLWRSGKLVSLYAAVDQSVGHPSVRTVAMRSHFLPRR